jgi:bacteriorhodopsin
MIPEQLTQSQFDTVYNFLSLVIASQLFTAFFLVVSQKRVLPRYRQALVMSAIVCGIAAYHYFRIFDSFRMAFTTEAVGGRGMYEQAAGHSFNEGYRYVDWLLTVPLLLAELIVVLALARKLQNSLLVRLIPASALMIALGYPGEISSDHFTRNVWGLLSTIPFLYILYVLFVELTKSLDRQPDADPAVRDVGCVPDRLPHPDLLRVVGSGRLGGQAGRLLDRRHSGEVPLRLADLPDRAPEVLRRRSRLR